MIRGRSTPGSPSRQSEILLCEEIFVVGKCLFSVGQSKLASAIERLILEGHVG